MAVTIALPAAETDPDCPVRSILDRVGDKWTALVISNLAEGPLRFTELKRRIERISQRMLTETLRGLERDGMVTRTVYPTIPPKVEYTLTPLGETLLAPVQALVRWALDNRAQVSTARQCYDRRLAQAPSAQ
ncbi:MAG: transcriptional regulator [Cytophagaceae bacterium]|nr:MAG: transcriptional regulator [Cytophagaceae bacterium]